MPTPVHRHPVLLEAEEMLSHLLRSVSTPRILEAGCGDTSWFRYPDGARVTGIDISPEQLNRHPGLDDRIVGDIESFALPSASFDAIICWNVLEHLPHPDLALAHMVEALAPGGMLLIGVPHIHSLKGRITRWTPHAVHVCVYRHLLGYPYAGRTGRAPFRTFMRSAISPDELRRALEKADFAIPLFRVYRSTFVDDIEKTRLLRICWRMLGKIVGTLSFGRIVTNETDIILLAQRNNSLD